MANIKNSVVVITGASSGIGRATALEIARRGGTCVLVARRRRELNEVVRECKALGGEAMAMAADTANEDAMQAVAEEAYEIYGRLDTWVNNAAVSLFARFEEAPPEDYRRVIETNLFGYINGARAALPYFREQGRGILINVSSVVGRVAQPFTSAYSTSKFAIDGFSESLRMEVLDTPEIHICTILPASIDTPIFEQAGNYTGKQIKPMEPVYDPDEVATSIVRCIESPSREIVVGRAGKALLALKSLLPAAAEKLMARNVRQDHFQDESAADSSGNIHTSGEHGRITGGWGSHDGNSQKTAMIAAGVLTAGAVAATSYYYAKKGRMPTGRRVREAASDLRDRGESLLSRASDVARFWE